ncbi:ATP-binding cassette domain-containing protein [Arcanobacterium phocisimile]|uniref:ATP-binding cassette domain-containing protein n=1 Tax=Arcanobacterium phocisimile TaxID=1302235 RepID=UPI0023BA4CFD|nr:ATP-binding cassette domain-containing protein [Arcanobacterium phocisimile]
MTTVSFDQASRIFPGANRAAVDQLSLEVDHGEFLVLVGPSGCGKSTSLRMVAGLEPVNAGRVFIDGQDMARVRPRVIGTSPSSFNPMHCIRI